MPGGVEGVVRGAGRSRRHDREEVTMAREWAKFPHAAASFEYAGVALGNAWARLHKGDHEAYPADSAVADAWRHFHAGAFRQAVDAGRAAGGTGVNAAVKAQCVYAHYLERDSKTRLALFEEAAAWADERRKAVTADANAHYLYAYALGRYGESVSAARTLAQRLGGKISDALATSLALDAEHAEAALTVGAYQSHVIKRMGVHLAELTYGAKKETALAQFEQAQKLFPDSPIVHIEHANALILLFDKERLDDATKLYEAAAAAQPHDAMERLGVECAKQELE
jgi:tetratricopeptide (TPR) repeat protein